MNALDIKLIFIMPSPLLFGGMSSITKMYYDRKVIDESQYIHFNSSFRYNNKFLRFLEAFYKHLSFLMLLIKTRPSGIYVYTSDYWGFFDKATYCLIARIFNVRTALNLVGGDFFIFYKKNAFSRFLIRRFIRIPDLIVVGSKSWIPLLEMEFKDLQVALISNPVLVYTPVKDKAIRENKINFIFFGRLEKEKGVNEIINVLKSFDKDHFEQMTFTFAGKGSMGPEIKNRLDDLIKSGHVNCFEDVTEDEKKELLQNSNVYVLPSHAEVLPISLLEAMNFKNPAIVTSVGGIPDLIVEGKNGFLLTDPKKIEEDLKNLMIDFIRNPLMSIHMGEAAFEDVKKLDFSKIFESITSIFKNQS